MPSQIGCLCSVCSTDTTTHDHNCKHFTNHTSTIMSRSRSRTLHGHCLRCLGG